MIDIGKHECGRYHLITRDIKKAAKVSVPSTYALKVIIRRRTFRKTVTDMIKKKVNNILTITKNQSEWKTNEPEPRHEIPDEPNITPRQFPHVRLKILQVISRGNP